eukprot:gb/GECG01005596.1/.p1 GENE.gb/GECG01005596.1/~~gb/GECG01005596.1/.p1  ORF type:complete len:242 (+),score=27.46 gb/GECG01005596.1/:1-726(+)
MASTTRRAGNRPRRKRKWTPVEDEALLNTLRRLYQGDLPPAENVSWMKVQEHMPWRQSVQIRERYMHILDPRLRHGKIDREEMVTMLSLCDKVGKRWTEIAKYLPGRTSLAVKNTYYSFLRRFKREVGRDPVQNELLRFFKGQSLPSKDELVLPETSQAVGEQPVTVEAMPDVTNGISCTESTVSTLSMDGEAFHVASNCLDDCGSDDSFIPELDGRGELNELDLEECTEGSLPVLPIPEA